MFSKVVLLLAGLVASSLALTAQVTWYQSYPMCCSDPKAPYQEECDDYSGCKYQGDFANNKHLTLSQVKSTDIVSFFDSKNPSEAYWRKNYMNKKVKVTKNGVTFTATIMDTCADKDCGGCCTKNAKNGYLIDIEYWTARRHLGSESKVDGQATFVLV